MRKEIHNVRLKFIEQLFKRRKKIKKLLLRIGRTRSRKVQCLVAERLPFADLKVQLEQLGRGTQHVGAVPRKQARKHAHFVCHRLKPPKHFSRLYECAAQLRQLYMSDPLRVEKRTSVTMRKLRAARVSDPYPPAPGSMNMPSIRENTPCTPATSRRVDCSCKRPSRVASSWSLAPILSLAESAACSRVSLRRSEEILVRSSGALRYSASSPEPAAFHAIVDVRSVDAEVPRGPNVPRAPEDLHAPLTTLQALPDAHGLH